MTAHELAKMLLDMPNEKVFINGWGSDEGGEYEVNFAGYGVGNHWTDKETPRWHRILLQDQNCFGSEDEDIWPKEERE